MKTHATATRLLAAVLLVLTATTAVQAQVPAHAPGTICATAAFWCWASIPGPVGAPCSCSTASGYIPGLYI